MCASAHGLVGLGRIVYASSGRQLQKWQKNLGVEPGPLKGLPITEVLNGVQVDGPDEKLSEEVKALQYKYHEE